MARSRILVVAIVVLAASALAMVAASASSASPGSAPASFHPRIRDAMGLVPPATARGRLRRIDIASGAQTPVTYHGGPVMSGGVTLHTIFWAPSGYAFQGSPRSGIPTYEGLIQQFFTDVAADTGAPGTCTTSDCNVFTAQRQYAQGTSVGQITPGAYALSYNATADTVNATDPYPSKSKQCASPAGTAVCITDRQVAAEVDHIVQATGGGRGLHNLWFVFLPPGVDECITPGACGTNTFAGYHAVFNIAGHGATIYAVAIDPIIEGPVPMGADPQGYPDAELELDVAAHEVNEATTDPEGNGWMDPNGFEIGDKCDTGPQTGIPLGFAANGSPFNQVINGHQYLLQEEWANSDSAGNADCVQAADSTSSRLPLPQVALRQFDPRVTGNVNQVPGGGIRVRVSLRRADRHGNPVVVARASTITRADGTWQVSLWPHAPGDDRDEIDVDYSGPGAPQPHHQVILTGNGGNPFSESGWTGWVAMDAGSALTDPAGSSSLQVGPCFQVGTLSYTVNGAAAATSPNDFCNTQTDVANLSVPRVGKRDVLTWTSNDNRAFDDPTGPAPNLFGGLVSLTVPVGEPGSVSAFSNPLAAFAPGGFPSCLADLELEAAACTGLVPGETYRVSDSLERVSGTADSTGTLVVPLLVFRGDSVRLSNRFRTLTTLHVANLRLKIFGNETFASGGSCQPGEYYGQPLSKPPSSATAGLPSPLTTGGVALTGKICPTSGHVAGLPVTAPSQTDELSGGQTETEVPAIENTSPINGETVSGRFTALAQSGLRLPGNQVLRTDIVTQIGLRILTLRGAPVLRIRNVDTPRGVPVPGLRPGNYYAVWTLTDLNGDTRVLVTRFVSEKGGLRPVAHRPRRNAPGVARSVADGAMASIFRLRHM